MDRMKDSEDSADTHAREDACRPVLLPGESISRQLTDDEIEAIRAWCVAKYG